MTQNLITKDFMAQKSAKWTAANSLRANGIQRYLWISILGWAGGISFLSGTTVLAQPLASVPVPSDTAPSGDLAPAQVVPPTAPSPVAPETLPREFSAPVPVAPLPQRSLVKTPPIVPAPSQEENYEAPSAIVFSERSTGCQVVVRGQVTGLCNSGVGSTLSPGNSSGARTGMGALPSNITAVQVGGLSAAPGLGIATTNLKDFYRRTLRPPAMLGNGNMNLIFPLSIPAAISSMFGWRIHPITGEARFHTGTDLAAPVGTPVLAAFAGRVAIADFLGGYGLAVTLDHNRGSQQTLYGHLSEIFVQPGETVKQGDVIGRVGTTGNSTGPHLHFEFRQLTPDGWVALDAGSQLEFALAQLVKTLEFAQAPAQSAKANAGIQGVIQ